ncbi:MAG: glycosyltransferase [Candidatus Glassbacteria bacterium]
MRQDVLVLTTLDYAVEKNQRCQHVARALANQYGAAVVIAKHRNISVRTSERVRKLLPSVRVYREGPVKVYDLNPPLNQSFAKPFRFIGLISEILVVISMLLLFLSNVRRRFPLCYAEGPWETLVALVLKAFGKVECIIYGDIDLVPAFQVRPLRILLTSMVENFTIRRADLVVCTGNLLAEKRREELGVHPVVIHNGVNYRIFSAGAVKEDHPPTIIYFGNFEERYSGISIALEGFTKIRREIEGIRLTLIGPDPDGAVERRIRKLGIDRFVLKLDPVPYIELPYYIRRSDIGYALFPPNPLRTYAFPLKVIEYMAGGLAVVGTKGTETELVVEKYGCGFTIPFDVDAYVEAIVDLFSNRERLAMMAENGVKHATSFDWDRLMNDMLESIGEVYGTGIRSARNKFGDR